MVNKFILSLCIVTLILFIGCKKSNRVTARILTDINHYSATMSSVPGLPIHAVIKGNYNDKDIVYHWQTDYGVFLSWNNKISTLGQNICYNNKKLYWSFNERHPISAPRVRIVLTVETKSTKKILAKTFLILDARRIDDIHLENKS